MKRALNITGWGLAWLAAAACAAMGARLFWILNDAAAQLASFFWFAGVIFVWVATRYQRMAFPKWSRL